MKKIVVDASVAIKWFIPEVHSEGAARFLDPEVVLSAPDLIVPELGNTLWKKVRRAEITRVEAGRILGAFAAMPIDLHPAAALLPAAFEIALELDRSVYDSLYLTLAVAENCELVTADAKFHAAVLESPLASHICWVDAEA